MTLTSIVLNGYIYIPIGPCNSQLAVGGPIPPLPNANNGGYYDPYNNSQQGVGGNLDGPATGANTSKSSSTIGSGSINTHR